MSKKLLAKGGAIMIRFLGNKYTRDQIIVLRKAIDTAYTDIFCNGYNCVSNCAKCKYYRPCHDLANLLAHLGGLIDNAEK